MPRAAAVVRYAGKRGVVWRVKYADAEGKQVMETVGAERDGVTRKQAESELRERLVKVERRGYRRPRPLAFRDYAETWFAEGESRRRWRPGTVKQYRSVRRRLVEHFGAMPLAVVRPRNVAEYVAATSKSYGASTVSRDVSVLHAIFTTAKREELVESNPAERAERPKQPRRQWRVLSPVEVASVRRAFVDEQARVVFLTLVLTGIRCSELQALRWRDVDLVENILRVQESKSEEGIRSIALSSTLAEELWQHRRRSNFQGNDELVFCHPERGSRYRADVFRGEFHKALKAAGITDYVRPHHDLRHTALTNDAAAGASELAVMSKAGHRNMATTRQYLHLAGVVFRDEAERLERRLLGVESSTHLSESQDTQDDRRALV